MITEGNASRLALRTSFKAGQLRGMRWSPTAVALALATGMDGDHWIDLVQVPSLGITRLEGAIFTYDMLFSQDGAEILAASRGVLIQWDAATGRITREFDDPNYQCMGLLNIAFSPDGKKVLAADVLIPPDGPNQTVVSAFDLGAGKCQGQFLIEQGSLRSLEVSPGGEYMLLAFSDGPPGPSRVEIRDGHTISPICTLDRFSSGHLVGSGDLVAVGKAQVELYELPDCAYIRVLADSWFQADFAVSPAGTLLAAPNEGEIRLWSIATGEMVAEVPTRAGGTHKLQFSPDGRWLADGWLYESSEESEIRLFALTAE